MSKDFIDATIEKKPADAKNAFVELITQKLDDALEAKKVQLAQEMFDESEEVELTADEQEFFNSLSDEELEAIANLPDEEELEEEQVDKAKRAARRAAGSPGGRPRADRLAALGKESTRKEIIASSDNAKDRRMQLIGKGIKAGMKIGKKGKK